MNALQVMALRETVERQLKDQAEDLVEEIAAGCEVTDRMEVVCGKMIANAVAISVRISLGTVLDLLIDAGVVEPCSDDELRRKRLSVVERQNE